MKKYVRYVSGSYAELVAGMVYIVDRERKNMFDNNLMMYEIRINGSAWSIGADCFDIVSCPCGIANCITHRKPS
jgi:hypothetical protein